MVFPPLSMGDYFGPMDLWGLIPKFPHLKMEGQNHPKVLKNVLKRI